MGFLSAFVKLFRKNRPALSEDEAQALRDAFKKRCHHFRMLLGANNRALDVMTEIEEALKGTTPFGATYVRTQCIRVASNVHQIITNLNAMSDNRYPELADRFKAIQQRITEAIQPRQTRRSGPLVLPLSQAGLARVDAIGGKMANLGELANRLQLRIPAGFAITAYGYERFMQENDLQKEIDRRIQMAEAGELDELYSLSSDIQQLIIRAPLPAELAEAILAQYRELEATEGTDVRVVVRSSALGEDLLNTSFAGQYHSELNVSGENLLQTYKEILASKYGVTAMTYRLARGIPDEAVPMCVGCLRMIDAVAGGVMYTRNPLSTYDDAVMITAVPGLPKAVVDGSVDTDVYAVARDEPLRIVRREIASKKFKFVCDPVEGVCREEVLEAGDQPCLRDEQVFELAALAIRIEHYYEQPQDIEWALDTAGRIFLLQSRPLKQETLPAESPNGGDERESDTLLLRGGVNASPGAASGPVCVVKKEMDALRFPDGAVLVTAQSLPAWATLLGRAAAVVTEHGSIAGHLANVAREFGVPALFGVAGAIQALHDAGVVTVDADRRTIHRGRVEALLQGRRKAKNLMEGSPVYTMLQEAARSIIPLRLLDPEAAEFAPAHCASLHDITRFCHEVSVREMFGREDQERTLPERGSKQLFYNVPMQYWVIDLDDGFNQVVDGRFVQIGQIASIPMLALWEGMIAVPIDTPPPLDTRGFMSVLLEASTNPELGDPSMGSSFVFTNYFMISKHFCSLQSRFGFHFCTVEALIGETEAENYASFQFKGGAADMQRRILRAEFIGELLEENGFRTEIRQDALFARIEGYPRPFMEERLRILGYLIIHTRQLDMIMTNPDIIAARRAAIRQDLARLLFPVPQSGHDAAARARAQA